MTTRLARRIGRRLQPFWFHDVMRRREEIRILYDLRRRYPTLTIEDRVRVVSPDRLILGKGVLIMSGALLDCGGLEWCDHQGRITLGDRCAIGPDCILFGAGEIEMETDSGLGPGVRLIAQDANLIEEGLTSKTQNTRLRFDKIVFREGAWAATGAIVLAGSDIGKKSVVGPGAVVKGKVPPHSIALGNPARILPMRLTAEKTYRPL